MITEIIRALTDKDSAALASCFSENGMYTDYCPSINGGKNNYVYGSAGVEMYCTLKFLSGDLEIAEPVIEDEFHATFFEDCGGPFVYAQLTINEFDADGLVKKAVVHPV